MRTPVLTTAILLSGAACLAQGASPYADPRLVCRLQDQAIQESSGLASSSRSGDYFFTHNDSGDEARFFAVNRHGKTLATYRVTGAEALDWEDMARGPDGKGGPALYLGDIGDNFRLRAVISVYRVPEPKVNPSRTGVTADTPRAERFDLEYEDGPQNAETLLVHPRTGQLLIVTKAAGASGIYAAPLPLKAGAVNRLYRKGEVRLADLPRPQGAGKASPLSTAGDLSPDGKRAVVRTYTDAYEWTIDGDDVAAAFRKAPAHVALPKDTGGEAIAYSRDGDALLTTTEGRGAPVHELRRR